MRTSLRLPRSIRQLAQPWRIVITAYSVVGLAILVFALVAGDWLGVTVAFFGIGAVVGTVLAAGRVARLTKCVAAVNRALRETRRRLDQIEKRLNTGSAEAPDGSDTWLELNLAAIGRGDPSVLSTTTLDRSMFPRLVSAMDEEPPASSTPDHAHGQPPEQWPITTGVATKNLLRTWVAALRERDLVACREVYATLVDTADPTTVVSLATQLQQLDNQVERSLRAKFSACVRERDYAKAIETGERIRDLWPDGSAARDFERIRPYLMRRVV